MLDHMLYFLRHAHAEIQSISLSDFDRHLDERGKKEAQAVAEYLQNKGIFFDFIMCSAACRARETLEFLKPSIGTNIIEIKEDYYNISAEMILDYLKLIPDTKHKILYIGHNPGIAFSILKLTKVIPDFLFGGIMPATLVGFDLSIAKWKDLDWGEAEIIDVFQPNLFSLESPAPQQH